MLTTLLSYRCSYRQDPPLRDAPPSCHNVYRVLARPFQRLLPTLATHQETQFPFKDEVVVAEGVAVV